MKARIFKNGVQLGHSKSVQGAINAVVNTCKVHGFDVSEYVVKDYFSDVVLWEGKSYINKEGTGTAFNVSYTHKENHHDK